MSDKFFLHTEWSRPEEREPGADLGPRVWEELVPVQVKAGRLVHTDRVVRVENGRKITVRLVR